MNMRDSTNTCSKKLLCEVANPSYNMVTINCVRIETTKTVCSCESSNNRRSSDKVRAERHVYKADQKTQILAKQYDDN